jgi:hypothetical protein
VALPLATALSVAPLLLHDAARAEGLPCFPCTGVATSDPAAAARQLGGGWQLPDEARFDVAWPIDLTAEVDAAAIGAAADAISAAGGQPWLRLQFAVPSPIRDHGVELAAQLERAVGAARASSAGGRAATYSIETAGGLGFDAVEYAFLLKRAAVAINGAAAAARIATAPLPAERDALQRLYAEEVNAYVDRAVLSAEATPLARASALTALSELDPGKPIVLAAVALPTDRSPWGIAAEAAIEGAGTTLFAWAPAEPATSTAVTSAPAAPAAPPALAPPPTDALIDSLKVLATDFVGDLAYDPSSNPAGGGRAFAFVRGDLALRVIAEAPAGEMAWNLTFADAGIRKITRLDPKTGREAGVGGKRVDAGVEVKAAGGAVSLRLERASAAELGEVEGVKDTVQVSGQRDLPVEEILRRLQAFEDAQARRLRTLEGVNSTSLRFGAGGGNSVDATFRGAFFQRTGEPADWAWEELFVNGVKWRSKTLPEIPIVQPEKAAAMPLEILFTKEYRYALRGTETIEGRDCWVVDFAPLARAADAAGVVENKRLYQGTVWVDRALAARVRTKALQLGLQGDVLSNEETFFYRPVDAVGGTVPWSAEAFVVATRSVSQQMFSVINQSTLVEKETTLESVRINQEGFDERRAAVLASDSTMVRDTDAGLRYLVKSESGERVVKEGFDSSKLFLLGGAFYDDSLDYPLPIGGINYLDLDFRGRGQQFNAFFAGALGTLNWSDPSIFGSRFDAGADSFFFAVPTEDQVFRGDEEAPAESVTSQVVRVGFSLGRPIGSFFKWGANLGATFRNYDDAEDTADDFRIPSDNVTTSFSLDGKYSRSGYVVSAAGALHRRSEWEPWGFAGNPEYDPAAKDYSTWRFGVGKTWHLSGFKKFGAEAVYVSGSDLDRFSKFGFGFFGDTRVHGYQSDRVRAEEAIAAHLRYGFEVGQVFRIDALFDAAWATDEASGLDRELLSGVGVQGTFLGPWQTIVNMDVGVALDGPDDGVAIYIAFLKLFK